MGRNWTLVDYGSYTITDTAGVLSTFADANMPTAWPTGARSFVGQLATAQVRARGDGTAPTTTEGEPIDIADKVVLSLNDWLAMSWVRTGATSGVLKGHFYNVEAGAMLGGE